VKCFPRIVFPGVRDLSCPALNVPPEPRVGNFSPQRRGATTVSPVSVHRHIVFFPLHVMLRLQLRAGQSGKVPANRMPSSPPEFDTSATGAIEHIHPITPSSSFVIAADDAPPFGVREGSYRGSAALHVAHPLPKQLPAKDSRLPPQSQHPHVDDDELTDEDDESAQEAPASRRSQALQHSRKVLGRQQQAAPLSFQGQNPLVANVRNGPSRGQFAAPGSALDAQIVGVRGAPSTSKSLSV
jgi:hypothetical protein